MRYKVTVGARETWIPSLPASLRHEFSMEELVQMQQQFCDFDESGDGSIAATELVVLMKSMGIEATLDEVQGLIDNVDDNHSGELEFHEFVRLVSEFRRGGGDNLASFIQYSKLVLLIRKELADLQQHPTNYSMPHAVKEDAWAWRVEMRGPPSTPYEGGTFIFSIQFSHEYPYEAPSVVCQTRLYHPNFVPLLNGSMALYGFMERWQPEWRMRALLEQLEQLLTTPDVDLMTAFYDETTVQLSHTPPTAKTRMRHPREITIECIDTFANEPDKFYLIAKEMTRQMTN